MTFEADAFISYAHLDNVGLSEDHKGWVAQLHRALEVRLGQLLGRRVLIWRDPKLQGNDVLEDALLAKLTTSAALLPVLSPLYVNSEWGRRELDAFCSAAERTVGLRIRERARIFKVLKTPVPLEHHPPELRELLGYEFFSLDPETGRFREMDEIFGPEAERDFWMKLDDLAHDMSRLLALLSDPDPVPTRGAVFLAETTADLRAARDAIKRDLQQHGYTVLPDRPLPLHVEELKGAVRDDLARCRMSIHMIGPTYSLVPEGAVASLSEIQNELAIERAARGSFARLLWIPPGLTATDDRQRSLLQRIRMDERMERGADLLETPLDALRTVIDARLTADERGRETPAAPAAASGNSPTVYLMHDVRDGEAVTPWIDALFERFEVLPSIFTGDEAEIREYHEENLRTCDGALIYYGAGNEFWLRRKLAELQKSPGFGRTKPRPVVGICLAPPKTAEKSRFRTHHALLIDGWDGVSPERVRPFITALEDRGGEDQGGVARNAG